MVESLVGKYGCARAGFRLICSFSFRFPKLGPAVVLRGLIFFSFLASAFAQGGPPYYTNDPGTPGHLNWEINLGYMPFFYSNQSVSHTPDLDINFGVGDRIQLTYENAWLRVQNPSSETKFGLGQSNLGLKWRFYDAGESGLNISIFPQAFLNNPNDAVRRGITPASQAFLLPFEFSKKFGPVAINIKETVRRNGRDRHLWHDVPLAPAEPTSTIIGLLDWRRAAGLLRNVTTGDTGATRGKLTFFTMSTAWG